MRVGVACLLVGWAILTYTRVREWDTAKTLWTSAVNVTPDQPSAWLFLGAAEFQYGCPRLAWRDIQHAQDLLASRPLKPADKVRTLSWYWVERVSGSSLLRDSRSAFTGRFAPTATSMKTCR